MTAARVKKGKWGGDAAFRDALAWVFGGAPRDSATDGLIILGEKATKTELALAFLDVRCVEGEGADAVADTILRSSDANELVVAIREAAADATSRLVQALPWRASVTDVAIAALALRIRNRR